MPITDRTHMGTKFVLLICDKKKKKELQQVLIDMTDKRSLYVLRYDQSPSQPLLVSSRGEASATTLFQRRRLRQNMSGLKIPSFSRKNINNDGRMILYLIETTKAKLKRFHTNFASASM